MEQPCHRCATPVDEGVAFCPACNAPQIRVSGLRPEAFTEATPPLPPGTPGQVQPPAEPVPLNRLDWRHGLPAAAVAGAVSGLAALSLPGSALWVVVGAALAVLLYRKRGGTEQVVTAGISARMGALTGLIAFVVAAVGASLLVLAGGQGDRLREEVQKAMQQAAAQSGSDPRAQEALEFMMSPSGMIFMLVSVAVVFLVIFVLLGTLGGALGSLVFGKPRRR